MAAKNARRNKAQLTLSDGPSVTLRGVSGWPSDLSDNEILARLLALNLERASQG